MTDFEEKLDQLQQEFRSGLTTRLADIVFTWQHLQGQLESHKAVDWRPLYRQVHSLAGSAGTFGYEGVGDRARSLQLLLEPLTRQNRELGQSDCHAITVAIQALEASIPTLCE